MVQQQVAGRIGWKNAQLYAADAPPLPQGSSPAHPVVAGNPAVPLGPGGDECERDVLE